MTGNSPPGGFRTIAAFVLGAALLGFAGGWAWQATGAGRGATEAIVRDYILDHPEVLPEAMQRLQEREIAHRIAPLRAALEAPYPGAVLGNPQGSVVLVEFADYACPFCRQSVEDVEALIAANKDLKVVLREDPVLSEESADAARMALAAADQGRFAAFHKAMYAQDGVSAQTIAAAARQAGVDLAKAQAAIAAGKYDSELENNRLLAATIGFSGTPAWVAGNQGFAGAVGKDTLNAAIAQARGEARGEAQDNARTGDGKTS